MPRGERGGKGLLEGQHRREVAALTETLERGLRLEGQRVGISALCGKRTFSGFVIVRPGASRFAAPLTFCGIRLAPRRDMRAVAYFGPSSLPAITQSEPAIESEQDVIVRVTRSGLCGSDLPPYQA